MVYRISLHHGLDSVLFCSSGPLVILVSRADSDGGGCFGDPSVEALLRDSRPLICTYRNAKCRTLGRTNVPKAFWVSWSLVHEQLSTRAVREMRRRKSRRNILTGITCLALLGKFAQHSPIRSCMGTSICNVTKGETSPLYIAIYSWSTLSTPHRLVQYTQLKERRHLFLATYRTTTIHMPLRVFKKHQHDDSRAPKRNRD
jgi:hypothetical protein